MPLEQDAQGAHRGPTACSLSTWAGMKRDISKKLITTYWSGVRTRKDALSKGKRQKQAQGLCPTRIGSLMLMAACQSISWRSLTFTWRREVTDGRVSICRLVRLIRLAQLRKSTDPVGDRGGNPSIDASR